MGPFNACSTTFAEFDPIDEVRELTPMLRKDLGKGLKPLLSFAQYGDATTPSRAPFSRSSNPKLTPGADLFRRHSVVSLH
jgi:hypothetical protein